MAATVKRNFWLYSTDDNLPAARVTLKIAASQGVLMPGAPLYLSQSGTAKVSDTSDGTGDVYQYVLDTVVAAELAANTEIQAVKITPNQIWAVYVENNDSDAAVAQANIGNVYGLRVATGTGKIGYVTLDLNNANGAVKVVNVMQNVEPNKYSASSNPGIALARFLPSVIDAQRA
jgi:hypothetical protein